MSNKVMKIGIPSEGEDRLLRTQILEDECEASDNEPDIELEAEHIDESIFNCFEIEKALSKLGKIRMQISLICSEYKIPVEEHTKLFRMLNDVSSTLRNVISKD